MQGYGYWASTMGCLLFACGGLAPGTASRHPAAVSHQGVQQSVPIAPAVPHDACPLPPSRTSRRAHPSRAAMARDLFGR